MKYAVIIAALILFGCNAERGELRPDADAKGASQFQNRFTVELVQSFTDNLAYQNVRGVYILTDTETGERWIGVSGIGISTLGSHHVQTGKAGHQQPDER